MDPSQNIDLARTAATVREVMSPGIIVISSETTVAACAASMFERRTHAVLVVDQRTREPTGWVFHQDVLRYLRSDPLTTMAGDVVSADAAYIDPEATVDEAAQRMVEDNITHLLVGKSPGQLPEGVLSSWDLVAYYARPYGRS